MQEYRLAVAVVMQRRALDNRWQPYSWQALNIVSDQERAAPRVEAILDGEQLAQWLHTGFVIELFRDEAENYYLNVSAGQPCVFVMWSMEEGMAIPRAVTLSYGEAARMMDAGEQVDNVPMPEALRPWLDEFVRLYYRPQPQQRIRPPSFRGARRSDS